MTFMDSLSGSMLLLLLVCMLSAALSDVIAPPDRMGSAKLLLEGRKMWRSIRKEAIFPNLAEALDTSLIPTSDSVRVGTGDCFLHAS